jgi:ferredoxin
VPSSCLEGVCGTCETAIVDGEAEHRDSILSADEQEANETMMICVSRSKTPSLVLDL